MGLDLTIRTQTNFTTNEKGQDTWTVTCIGNLRNCWNILEEMQNYSEIQNCTTVSLEGRHFHKILEDLKEELPELNDNKKADLEYEIRTLENLIKENNIEDNDMECYEVHAWF
jgi:hypothetical protein